MDVEGRAMAGEAQTHPKYRPDIDGLRAIAVLSVVGYHAFPEWIHGGFIGVDIFFVISGFLISTIIFKSLSSNEFSFIEFYSRRVRRIFPALATVLLAVYVAGWFILYPDEYRQLGKHIFGGAGFISNIVLWRESGYFDSAAEMKPLLHLWSLGIEEQFYIVFPLFAWLAWKYRLNILTLVIVTGLLSFLLNVKYIYQDPVWTFYQPQTRFWELMAGSLLALLVIDTSGRIGKLEATLDRFASKVLYRQDAVLPPGTALANSKAWLGTLLLAVALYRINKEFHFPGKWAAVPTAGAALLIWAGPRAFLNGRLLSNPLLVWVGKISYPLYLWHWVILAYLRILASGTPSVAVRCGAVVAAIILSWLTYRFIERPLRFGNGGGKKTIGLIVIMAAIATTGFVTYKKDGFGVLRQKAGMASSEQFAWDYMGNAACVAKVKTQPGFCMQLGNPDRITIGVIGDSTANALVPGISELVSSRGEGMINIGHGACPPVRGLVPTETWGARPNCPDIVDDAYRIVLADDHIKTVIMSIFTHDMQYWGFKDLPANASLEERFAKSMSMLDADIEALRAKGKKVILTYDSAYSPVSSKDCMHRPYSQLLKKQKGCDVSEDMIIDRYPYLTMFDEHFKNRADVCVFRQSDLLFTDGKLNLIDANGNAILRDSHHLSVFGSKRMARMLSTSNCSAYLPWAP